MTVLYRIVFNSLLLLLLTTTSGFAATRTSTEFAVAINSRTDQLDWNIAGDLNGQNPNVLSELTWRDLQIQQLTLDVTSELIRVDEQARMTPTIHLALGYGSIFSGTNQDSDYEGDNRTMEVSRSNNQSDSGEVFDVSLGLGGKFHFSDEKYSVTPQIGYSYHEQNLTMTDGYQTIPATGAFFGLNSSYDAEWSGPWFGVDATAQVSERLGVSAGAEFHAVTFNAAANWNLRDDFAHPTSFKQSATGYGLVGRCGVEYALTGNLLLAVQGELRSFQARDGTDTVFFSDGSIGMTRLNRVNWESSMLSTGIQFRF